MSIYTVLQYAIFIGVLLLITKPLGIYIYRVFNDEHTFLNRILCPIENSIYYICGIDKYKEQNWLQYAASIIIFSLIGLLLLYVMLRLQQFLPLNPQHFANVPPALAFNTSISFIANTNWQAYSGESSMSYFSQMAGLAVHNFLSGAVGIAVAIAFIRGFARESTKTIGNFWVDLTRATLWILLPLSIIIAIIYIAQGVPQNFSPYINATTLAHAKQIIAQGPIASQEAIKSLATNGGGFFNANSAHPYENPTALTNFIQALSIFAIGAALTYTFGRMVGKPKQGWTILIAMLIMFIVSLSVMHVAEMHPNALFHHLGVNTDTTALQSGGNMEGKEVRFGIGGSVLYNTVSTAASDGGINSTLDSFTPIGGAMALINMALGEIIVGGVGAGLYSILLYVLLAVFIAGLMVGRTPEFLGKKITSKEMKLVMIALLISPFFMLLFTAIACLTPNAIASIANHGPHGFTEIFYAYISTAANNGSAFAGLNANTNFYNITTGLNMFFGRFLMIIPVLAIAGLLANKKRTPESAGTLPTTGPLFIGLLIGTIIIVAGLTFFPGVTLGPILEQIMMKAGTLF